jgi:ABC-type transport system involved in cytochrome bd biosynthesis fused ATPase/permease subunit
VAVVGPVGGGKSMLLQAILGESARVTGRYVWVGLACARAQRCVRNHGRGCAAHVRERNVATPCRTRLDPPVTMSDGTRSLTVNGPVAYAAQTPFIVAQSVRDNILFGLPYDPNFYSKACKMRQ